MCPLLFDVLFCVLLRVAVEVWLARTQGPSAAQSQENYPVTLAMIMTLSFPPLFTCFYVDWLIHEVVRDFFFFRWMYTC